MITATTTKLVNQTFVEGLHAQQGLIKKEFAELNKVDSERENQKKLREEAERNKNNDKYLVFNYLWHYFPEAMVTKSQDLEILCQEMGDVEFERTLKSARHFYKFRFYASALLVLGLVPCFLGIFGSPIDLFSFFGIMFALIPLAITYEQFFHPLRLYFYNKDRHKNLQERYILK